MFNVLKRLALHCLRGAILVCLAIFLVSCRGTPTAATDKYIEAIRARDYKTVIDHTHYFQAAIDRIKAKNPQVLWKDLIAGFYQEKLGELQGPAPRIPNYGFDGNDPTELIRSMGTLITASCKWSITETRTKENLEIVFVTVSYPTVQGAPVGEPRRFKHVILVFSVDAPSNQIVSMGMVNNGAEFWPIPPITSAQARDLANAEMLPTLLHPHAAPPFANVENGGQRWLRVSLPQFNTPWLSEYKGFFHDHGFQYRNFEIQPFLPGHDGEVLPPPTWSRYQIFSDNGRTYYRLEESTDLQVISLNAPSDSPTATATVRLVHSGCSPVCAMIRDYWRQAIDKHMYGNADQFFLVRWHGAEDERGVTGGMWPLEENRNVSFQWNSARLEWHVVR